MLTFADRQREQRIKHFHHELVDAPTTLEARAALMKMMDEIKHRSPEVVRAMEQARGLA